MDEFREKFRIAELTVNKFNFWTVSIRPQQITLGSLVLSLNRTCKTLAGITAEEAAELASVFSAIEQLFSKTLEPQKINYIALMMIDDQVHFHVIPRYAKTVTLNTVIYEDQDWPKPPTFANGLDFSEEQFLFLKNTFK